MGFLFPKQTAALPEFNQLLEPYLYRWDLAVTEDNEISINQQKAAENPFHRPGPYHGLEFAVHRFDNMVLDAVLGGEAQPAADSGGAATLAVAASARTSMFTQPVTHAARGMHARAPGQTRAASTGTAAAGLPLAPGENVCVTGATGFIALHLVEQLLTAGYRVTAAVRTNDASKLAPLTSLSGLGELTVVPGCDLLTPGSFDHAVADASAVFHTASPFWMDSRIKDPWEQLVNPAEKGTLNVLDACAKEGSAVRRVVLTSSFAALMNVGGRSPWPMDFVYDETHWNISSAPDADGMFPEPVNAHAYRWSKTMAERAAWAYTGKFDVATVLPPMVLGANKQKLSSVEDLNQSSLILYNLLAGKMPHVMPGSVGFVDVADVARAHVLAATVPGASGQRYLCSGETRTWLDVVGILRVMYPNAPLPTTCPDGSTTQPCLLLKNDKIKAELGLDFVPLEQTLRAQCDALQQAGLLGGFALTWGQARGLLWEYKQRMMETYKSRIS